MSTRREQDAYDRMGRALDRVDATVAQLLHQGLQRVTRSSAEELSALAQTAHTAGMIRIERELEALATHVGRYLDADPLFRTGAFLGALNRVWLLAGAARRRWERGEGPGEMVDLLGEARRRYEPVDGSLDVQPVAASGWVTDTGFVGITVHLVARMPDDSERMLQASSVRPTMAFGNDPRTLLHQPVSQGSWLTVFEVAHTPRTLRGARISRDGRLGMGGDLDSSPAADRGAGAFSSLHAGSWAELVDRLRGQALDALGRGGGVLCYVEPARWGDLVLDDKHARARMALHDRQGAALWLQVRLAPQNNLLVDNLGLLQGRGLPTPKGLVGFADAAGGELRLSPITAVYEAPLTIRSRGQHRTHLVHLGLVPLEGAKRAPSEGAP